MTWLAAIFTGLLVAVLGGLGAGWLSDRYWVRWHKVSSMEGAAGYAVILHALCGALVGLVVGIVAARAVVTGEHTRWGMGLLYGVGAMGGLLVLATAVIYLGADFPPQLEGKDLAVEIEIGAPAAVAWPPAPPIAGDQAHVAILFRNSRVSGRTELPLVARERLPTRVVVPLRTSVYDKSVYVYFSRELSYHYDCAIPGRPGRAAMEWSEWVGPRHCYAKSQWSHPEEGRAPVIRYRLCFAE